MAITMVGHNAEQLLSAGQSLGIYFSHPRAISQTPVVTSDLRGAYVRERVESEYDRF